MSKIIAISNHKGGVGKTTSSVNIGAGLSREGKKVLLIDLDPQANLSQSLQITESDKTIYGSLKGDHKLEPIQLSENLHLIPSTLDLSGVEIELSGEAGREFILKELIDDIKNNYDYVIIDNPPSLGLLTINSFTASDRVLIPLQAEYLALQGLAKLIEVIEKVKGRLNDRLDVGGVFLTQFDNRKVLNRNVLETIEKHFSEKVLQTSIRNNIALAEAPTQGLDIFRYDEKSTGAEDYKNLTKEILIKL